MMHEQQTESHHVSVNVLRVIYDTAYLLVCQFPLLTPIIPKILIGHCHWTQSNV